jgi:GST-like protein
VLDKHLSDGREFIAGSEYSIADMASYPWVVLYEWQSQKIEDTPHVAAWFERIRQRPATERAYARAAEVSTAPVVDEESRKVLFGQSAATVRS